MAHTATVAQSLPAITQSATGETDFFTVTDVGILSETASFLYLNDIVEIGDLSERILFTAFSEYSNIFTAIESVEYTSTILYENTVTASETVGPIEWSASLSAVPLLLRDRVQYSLTVPVVQEMTISETTENSVTSVTADQLLISETAEPSATFFVEATGTLRIDDRLVRGLAEAVTDVMQIDNVIVVSESQVYQEASSSMVIAEQYVAAVRLTWEISDTGVLSESTSFEGSVANTAVSSAMVIRETSWSKDFGALAWVLNTETGGLSTYTNFGYNSLAEVNGVLYATSPEGVFAITGGDDGGRDIDAELQTGFLDFGNDQTKRLSDLFIGYTGGQLEVDTETYDGPQEVYTYLMEERDADAPRNSRAKIGRGLSSRYWRFAFRNIDGADFQVYDVAAEVATSKRRL